jgi:hypothetical protein
MPMSKNNTKKPSQSQEPKPKIIKDVYFQDSASGSHRIMHNSKPNKQVGNVKAKIRQPPIISEIDPNTKKMQ